MAIDYSGRKPLNLRTGGSGSSTLSSQSSPTTTASTANNVALPSSSKKSSGSSSPTGVFVEYTNSPITDIKSGLQLTSGQGVVNVAGGATAGGTSILITSNPYSGGGFSALSQGIALGTSTKMQPTQTAITPITTTVSQPSPQDMSWAMSRPTQTQIGALTIKAPPVETDPSKSVWGAFQQTQVYKNIQARKSQINTSPIDVISTGRLFRPGATAAGVVSEFVGYGATSSFPELRPVPTPSLIGIKATQGVAETIGKTTLAKEATIFKFEQSSIFKPTFEVKSVTASKSITSGGITSEVAGIKILLPSDKIINVARASTSTRVGERYYTVGEFLTQSGKKLQSSVFGTIGRETSDISGLKQFTTITAQEGRTNILTGERISEIMSIPTTTGRRISYSSIGSLSEGKLPAISIVEVGRAGTPRYINPITGETTSGSILKLAQEERIYFGQQPVKLIEQKVATGSMKALALEKGIITTAQTIPLLTSLTKTTTSLFTPLGIAQIPRTTFETPGTTAGQIIGLQLLFPRTGLTTGATGFFFGGSPTTTGTPPFVPRIIPTGGSGFDISGRRPRHSGVGAISARYIPNLRGLVSGKIATRTSGIFTGAEVRGITKGMAKALGYKTTRRRK